MVAVTGWRVDSLRPYVSGKFLCGSCLNWPYGWNTL